MDEQKRIIIEALTEFLASAKEDENKDRIKSAITMYFKVIVECCDFLIHSQILKVPYNHKERFELLERFFPEIYPKVSSLFKVYRKTYSMIVKKEDLEVIKGGCHQVLKEAKIEEHLPKNIKE
ncbi:MAG: hypothetical protein QF362_03965 [Candidatus Woesearchaeota archaeon]|jgi:uncharacterized protein YpbB|nr:hypothetical protein [Candidatus Woesearchaeota archaeon]MDP7506571.1 hypothetical protein [Candidatus Woesearchaeota archaeon]|tara:strand:+ start:380 stop:748 length:369 start_codon:yes stop_codon:yes gene_type:complete